MAARRSFGKKLMNKLLVFLPTLGGNTPYFVIFGILLLCGLGLPVPEDVTLVVAGLLSYWDVLNVWASIAVCLAGVLIGDGIMFFLGVKIGKRLTENTFFKRFLTEERLQWTKVKFHKYGNKLIFAARFMPGLRSVVFFSAGMLHLPFSKFILFDGMAALISVPTIVYLTYHFGEHFDTTIHYIAKAQHGIAITLGIGLIYLGVKFYLSFRKNQKEKGGNPVAVI